DYLAGTWQLQICSLKDYEVHMSLPRFEVVFFLYCQCIWHGVFHPSSGIKIKGNLQYQNAHRADYCGKLQKRSGTIVQRPPIHINHHKYIIETCQQNTQRNSYSCPHCCRTISCNRYNDTYAVCNSCTYPTKITNRILCAKKPTRSHFVIHVPHVNNQNLLLNAVLYRRTRFVIHFSKRIRINTCLIAARCNGSEICQTTAATTMTTVTDRSMVGVSRADGVVGSTYSPFRVIFKSGDRSIINNYRPISKLSTLSKLIEKLIVVKMSTIFSSLLMNKQHGFFTEKSINILSFLVNEVSCGKQVDLHSYLTNLDQIVKIGSSVSKLVLVSSRVPQGSHLSPLLFLIFINDVGKMFRHVNANDLFINTLKYFFLLSPISYKFKFLIHSEEIIQYLYIVFYSKSRDQENNERFPKLLIQSLRQATVGMKSFLDAVEHSQDVDKVVKLQKSLEQIRLGFNVSSFLPTSETKEIEVSYKDLMDNISKMIDKIISKKDNKEDEAEDELSYETLIGDSIEKLKKVVSDFMDKVNRAFKDTYGSKHCKKEDRSENDDLSLRSEVLSSILNNDEQILPDSLLKLSKAINHTGELSYIFNNSTQEPEYEVIVKPEEAGVFDLVDTLLDDSHKYIYEKENNLHPTLLKMVTKDIQILQKSLPAGIWVKTFENRMDLFSVMIRGPERTPYAGGLFMFDIKLPHTYPLTPPLCHYYSFCDDRLNPNLYEDGKVCLSLLGTWSGHGVELWSPRDSNLLQLLVSIQGLILVSEPYYNEAGFDSQRGQKLAKENSRVYNEMALIKVVQSMTNMLKMNYL
ncbi:Hypothetical protein CINCED_3A010546, partial [Cinara cedri]